MHSADLAETAGATEAGFVLPQRPRPARVPPRPTVRHVASRQDAARPDAGRADAAPVGQPMAPYRGGLKRVLDVAVVLVASPAVLAVVLLLALLVICDGGRPFFVQDRLGRGGRVYRMWKLRSMVDDAETRLERHLAADPAARAEWDLSQKLRNDPRITPLGRVLRKLSLDELPQLWNVLKGDMSLVGPRPMMPCQREIYPGTAYFRLRPGITGPWQVSERNAASFADRARFDADYDRRLSFGTDLGLLVSTVKVVLRGTGC